MPIVRAGLYQKCRDRPSLSKRKVTTFFENLWGSNIYAVCIAHGKPVSGDFKQFLENHPDMDFYDAKRKFKEEQKARQKVRQDPKVH